MKTYKTIKPVDQNVLKAELEKEKCENKYIENSKYVATCGNLYNCCNCGGEACGCAYCFSCQACEHCLDDD